MKWGSRIGQSLQDKKKKILRVIEVKDNKNRVYKIIYKIDYQIKAYQIEDCP